MFQRTTFPHCHNKISISKPVVKISGAGCGGHGSRSRHDCSVIKGIGSYGVNGEDGINGVDDVYSYDGIVVVCWF